ncbi:MAG: stage II sporulation protein R [Lachnospiraceae bacterium]|nr:stage II sporulation protein R [Lachnospiraceae bacterium]
MFLRTLWKNRYVGFLFLLLSVFLNVVAAAAHHSVIQQEIAEEVVRFHVLANSDREEDQSVKYQVRDAVLAWMSENIQSAGQKEEDRDAAMNFLSENLSQIEAAANAVLEKENMSYRATAEITKSYFPDRTYGEITFPAGWYDALRIRLGEAKGQNWWCLLYPNLCFSDCLHAVVEDAGLARLEEVLTVEEYESLLQSPGQWKISFRWF